MASNRPSALLFAFGAFVASLTNACAPLRAVAPSSEPWTNYKLNEIRHASTGSTMVEWIGNGFLLPGYRVEEVVTGVGTAPKPAPGSAFVARYEYHGTECPGATHVVSSPSYFRGGFGFLISEDGRIPCEKAQMRLSGVKRGRTYPVTVQPGTKAFTRCQVWVAGGRHSALKWELLYSGGSGNEIGILYREYLTAPDGVFARPAFYQELKYDLSRETRITFRDTVIEVLDANNSGVTSRVVTL